jgi:N-acetylmuramoyl-L-alanine amidase
MIGYDISDTNAAIIAFKRHFRNDSTNYINKEDESVIFQIINNKIKKK